jgi:plastocyanin
MKLARSGVIALLVLGAIAAACGDDDDDDDGTPTPAVGQTLPPGETPLQEDVALDIVAVDLAFEPNQFEVDAGDVVRFNFVNEGIEDHTMTIFRDPEYSQPLEGATTGVEEGIQTFTFLATFDEPGTYYFRCDFHPTEMTGTIEAQ